MSLSAAVIDALLATGATREQIAAAVKADIAVRESEEAAKLETKRAKARERQQQKRARDRNAMSRNVTVTACDARDTVSLKEDQNPSGTGLTDEADASSPVRQPVAEAVAHWNDVAPEVGWPTVQTVSANRSKLVSARLREHGIDGWKAAIARARASPYLAGADPPSWFTFPWLIKSENFLKVTEGNYDRNRSDRRQPSGWETAFHANMGGFGSG